MNVLVEDMVVEFLFKWAIPVALNQSRWEFIPSHTTVLVKKIFVQSEFVCLHLSFVLLIFVWDIYGS